MNDPIQNFNEHVDHLEKMFPDFVVTCGIAKYEHHEKGFWWIQLERKIQENICECCGSVKSKSVGFKTFSKPTFEIAYNDILLQMEATKQ